MGISPTWNTYRCGDGRWCRRRLCCWLCNRLLRHGSTVCDSVHLGMRLLLLDLLLLLLLLRLSRLSSNRLFLSRLSAVSRRCRNDAGNGVREFRSCSQSREALWTFLAAVQPIPKHLALLGLSPVERDE